MAELFACLAALAMLSVAHSASMTPNQYRFVKSQRAFADNCTRALYATHDGQNVFYSPYGVFRSLTLAYLAAGGQTVRELEKALHFDWANGNKSAVYDGYLTDAKEQSQNGNLDVRVAGRLYTSKATDVEPDFQANYGEILEKLNFAWRPRLSRARINDFIATATKGHITGHLRPADVTSKTNFVVADAAYLHGNWTQPFDRNATKAHEFRGYDRVGVVQMMEHSGQYQFGTHTFADKMTAIVLKVPYTESASMYFLLPQLMGEPDFDRFVENVAKTPMYQFSAAGRISDVFIQIPKMTFQQTFSMRAVLKHMGVDHVFGRDSNFSGMSKSSPLSISDIKHTARMDVDEAGTTAPIVTVSDSSEQESQYRFAAERPFVFIVYDRELEAVLFTGVYKNPR